MQPGATAAVAIHFLGGGRVTVEQAHVTATASQGQQRGHVLKSDRPRFGPCPYFRCFSLVLQRRGLRWGFGWKGFIRKVSKESWFCSREDVQGRGRGQMVCGNQGTSECHVGLLVPGWHGGRGGHTGGPCPLQAWMLGPDALIPVNH